MIIRPIVVNGTVQRTITHLPPAPPPPFSPVDIGLPEKFSQWRPRQFEAVERIVDSTKRFVMLCMPTGSGKSMTYYAAALLSGFRTMVLTATHGLQDQLAQEMEALSSDIRGLGNYVCPIASNFNLPGTTTVDDAPCQCGYRCRLRWTGECEYYNRYRKAQVADIVCTNYQMWMKDCLPNRANGDLQFGYIPDGLSDIEAADLKYKHQVQMLVGDECFPVGVLVDGRAIETIRAGDMVNSVSAKGVMEKKRVIRVFKRMAKTVVRIVLRDGRDIVCTPNHPFFTPSGWVPALLINYQTMLYNDCHAKPQTSYEKETASANQNQMCRMQETDRARHLPSQKALPEDPACSLQLEVCGVTCRQCRESQTPQRNDEEKESDERQCHRQGESSNQRENEEEFLWGSTEKMERRDWWSIRALRSLSERYWMAHGSLCSPQDETHSGNADTLPTRYSQRGAESGYRSGWGQPQAREDEDSRQPQGQNFNWVGVDHIEVHEQGDRNEFERLCGDGAVYNLEVEGNHNYFANGLLVHNCHDTAEQITMHVGVDINRKECLGLGMDWPGGGHELGQWQQWATDWKGEVADKLDSEESRIKNGVDGNGARWSRMMKRLRDMKRKLDRLSDMCVGDDWICTENQDRHQRNQDGKSVWSVRFDPLVPARYAEKVLWRGVDKIVLVSATVRPKTAELLGIDNDELEFVEMPSNFDRKRRPFVVVPSVQMNYRNEQDDGRMRYWLGRMDSVVDRLKHWKGVIHSTSYRRADFIQANSRHRDIIVTHGSRDRAEMVELFKQMEPPAILVSPSIATGYDFSHGHSRWQIVTKVPFASVTDPLVKARQKRDPEYGKMLAAQQLMQSYGRICRADDDWGLTVMLDDNFFWFHKKARKFLTQFFVEAVQWADSVNGVPDMNGFENNNNNSNSEDSNG